MLDAGAFLVLGRVWRAWTMSEQYSHLACVGGIDTRES